MILHRLASAIRKQDWFTVMLEILIVVLGVFIGIQVANWNAERADRVEAGNVLERLEQEFQMHLERTDRSLERHRDSVAAAARLIRGAESGQFDEDALHTDIEIVTALAPQPGPSMTFEELVSSGRLGLLSDAGLRTELLAYNDYIATVRSHHQVFSGPLTNARAELMRARRLEVSELPADEVRRSSLTAEVNRALLVEDPALMVTLQTAYATQNNIHAVLVGIRQRTVDILDRIETIRQARR